MRQQTKDEKIGPKTYTRIRKKHNNILHMSYLKRLVIAIVELSKIFKQGDEERDKKERREAN
jgi:hypothetical protein